MSATELQELGYSVVAYPCGSVFATAKALQKWAGYLKEHGTTNGYLDNMLNFDEYFELIGAREIREQEKEFLSGRVAGRMTMLYKAAGVGGS